jgi:hypothetical protein
MKKTIPLAILLLVGLFFISTFMFPHFTTVDIDGDHIDGPLGALLGLVFAGGGVLVAGFVMLVVGAVLAVVFAGVGILVTAAVGLAALMVVAAVSPLLLPLLLPLAIIWFFVSRARKQRALRQQAV